MSKTVCEQDRCAGCMACKDMCPVGAIEVVDGLSTMNACINQDVCTNCGLCERVCPQCTAPAVHQDATWYEGWASDDVRMGSTSGGAAAAISRAFVQRGGYVYSCLFERGRFVFRCTNNVDELPRFAGSKYVKSNPSGAYARVRELVSAGNDVLFIGLPCQVAAMRNVVPSKHAAHLFTVDLICHGTPSQKVLQLFLQQSGIQLDALDDIAFRGKPGYSRDGFAKVCPGGARDEYSVAFSKCLSYTQNCYSCAYAQRNRVSDLTLGDSWGSTQDAGQRRRGVSLVICSTSAGQRLLDDADLALFPVDANNAIAHNTQLRAPASKPPQRDAFFKAVCEGEPVSKAVRAAYPDYCKKQDLKSLLEKMHLYTFKQSAIVGIYVKR